MSMELEKYQVAWYDMSKGGKCFDEFFHYPEEANDVIDSIILDVGEPFENNESYSTRARAFAHFDNGDIYELKFEKVDAKQDRGYYYGEEQESVFEEDINENEFDDCEDDFGSYENDDMKFIWGIKSLDDLSISDACLYSMNDIELIYFKDSCKYALSIETIYQFEKEEDKIKYLKTCLDAFTKFMNKNGYDTERKPFWMDVFSYDYGTNMEFDSIEDCYAMFKLLVNGYCSL